MSDKPAAKIAVVEDEQMMFEIIKMSTKIFHFETTHLKATDDIVSIIKKKKIDLVTLDYMMPKKNGLQIAKEIREDKALQKLPIIFLTSRRLEQQEYIDIGKLELHYMPKPFVPHLLIAKMTELIGQAK